MKFSTTGTFGLLGAAAALSCFDTAAAQESGVDTVFGISLASTTLSFDAKLDADPNFPSYGLFGSVAKGRAFGTLTYTDSLGSENISEEDEIGDANRYDLDLVFGWRFGNAWTGFVGYKDGETGIDFRVRDSDIVQEEYYREDGAYVGASYALRFREAGTLSFTGAYIDLDTELRFTESVDLGGDDEDDDDDGEEAPEFDDLEGDFSGTGDGYSVGVNWVMPLTDDVAFRVLWKLNAYRLDVESDGMVFEPDQQLRYLEIGVLYAF